MRKKTQLKFLLIKEIINFDIMDFLYINTGLRYMKSIIIHIVTYIVNLF